MRQSTAASSLKRVHLVARAASLSRVRARARARARVTDNRPTWARARLGRVILSVNSLLGPLTRAHAVAGCPETHRTCRTQRARVSLSRARLREREHQIRMYPSRKLPTQPSFCPFLDLFSGF